MLVKVVAIKKNAIRLAHCQYYRTTKDFCRNGLVEEPATGRPWHRRFRESNSFASYLLDSLFRRWQRRWPS